MVTILMDADGCPVVDLTVQIGRAHGVPVKILCDTAHHIEREGAETPVFGKGTDSVDFALVNRVTPGDIVITQDYGLATMCLARRARCSTRTDWSTRPRTLTLCWPADMKTKSAGSCAHRTISGAVSWHFSARRIFGLQRPEVRIFPAAPKKVAVLQHSGLFIMSRLSACQSTF